MALIRCLECGKEVSDSAETCINCGCPIKKMIKDYKDKPRKKFNELSREEKNIVRKNVLKMPGYIIFNISIICLVFFDILFYPPLLALFINVPMLIFQIVFDEIFVKKYYNKNPYFIKKDSDTLDNKKYIDLVDIFLVLILISIILTVALVIFS